MLNVYVLFAPLKTKAAATHTHYRTHNTSISPCWDWTSPVWPWEWAYRPACRGCRISLFTFRSINTSSFSHNLEISSGSCRSRGVPSATPTIIGSGCERGSATWSPWMASRVIGTIYMLTQKPYVEGQIQHNALLFLGVGHCFN